MDRVYIWSGIAAVAFVLYVIVHTLFTVPACSNPLMHIKFDITKPGFVCYIHAFEQDIVVH